MKITGTKCYIQIEDDNGDIHCLLYTSGRNLIIMVLKSMRELYLAGIIILTVILSMIQEKVISILSHTG